MTNTIKFLIGAGIAGLVMLLLLGVNGGDSVGGVYNNVTHDFSEGISVDETVVIDGDRNITSANITANDITASDTGTTTIAITSSTSGRGGCLQMETTNGSTTRIYLAATTTVLTIEEGSCQ